MSATEGEVGRREFSSRELRNVLGAFPSGVTVITTGVERPYGMTASAFSAVSLDPPLVLVCVNNGTEGCECIEHNRAFAVNILSSDQEPLSRYFASKDRIRGPDTFNHIPHRTAVTRSPILDGAAAFLDCRLHASHLAGDHTIFIGEVVAIDADPQTPPLVFHLGSYRRLEQASE